MLSIALASVTDVVLERPEIVIPVAGFAVAAIAIVVTAWQRIEAQRTDAALKHDMIARGMSADEIERVLKAGSTAE